jgi:hypothetical protein
MILDQSLLGKMSRLGRLVAVAIAIACTSLCGCRNWEPRGERFQHDPLLELPRDLRQSEANTEFWGASNKARQIESNLGFSRDN